MGKKPKPKVLVVTELFPIHESSCLGTFVVSQLQALSEWYDFVVLVGTPGSVLQGQWKTRISQFKFQNFPITQVQCCSSWKGLFCRVFQGTTGKSNLMGALKARLKKQIIQIATELHSKHSFQLVHGHGIFVGDEASQIGKILCIPSLVTIHGLYHFHLKTFGSEVMKKVIQNLNETTEIVGVSQKVSESYQPYLTQKLNPMKIIPNGIFHSLSKNEIHFPKLTSKKRKKFLAAGFLVPEKKFDLLINVASKIRKQHGDIFIIAILGKGPEKAKLKKLIRKENLQTQVFLMGQIPPQEMRDWFSWADWFVHPSVVDSFSMVCLEAMAAEKPIICTQAIGLAEHIEPNLDALVVAPNSFDELYRALEYALLDETQVFQMGKKAYQKSQEFSWSRIAPRIQNEYSKLIFKGAFS